MQVNNINSTNFNGYKNVISKNIKTPHNGNFTFLSMQLNDLKQNDLTIWKDIQKNLLNIKEPSDVLTVESVDVFGRNDVFLSNITIDPRVSMQGSERESFIMKTHTLLASIAMRIMNDNNLERDNNILKVCSQTINNLSPFLRNNMPMAFNFVMSALNSENHPQEDAVKLMSSINKIMARYFA